MSEEIEAAGAAVTAGMAARAIEREGFGAPIGEGHTCANCGADVSGAYCATCGQPTHVHRSLVHFIEEALHGIFHFDTKAWRTLPQLAVRPGTLTHNYVHGKRAKYVSPVALFLLTIFLMFLAFSVNGNAKVAQAEPETVASISAQKAAAEADVATRERALEQAEANLAAAKARAVPGEEAAVEFMSDTIDDARSELEDARETVSDLDEKLTEKREADADFAAKLTEYSGEIAKLNDKQAKAIAAGNQEEADAIAGTVAVMESLERAAKANARTVTFRRKADGSLDATAKIEDLTLLDAAFEEIRTNHEAGNIKVNTGNKEWDKKVHKKLENPELAWYKLTNTAYKFSFLLVPISLPFLWLMFAWRRDITLFDHSVFGLYSLSFVSLLFIATRLIAALPVIGERLSEVAVPVAMMSVPVHMFFQLKGAYRLGVFSALVRTVILLTSAWICLCLFLASILFISVLG